MEEGEELRVGKDPGPDGWQEGQGGRCDKSSPEGNRPLVAGSGASLGQRERKGGVGTATRGGVSGGSGEQSQEHKQRGLGRCWRHRSATSAELPSPFSPLCVRSRLGLPGPGLGFQGRALGCVRGHLRFINGQAPNRVDISGWVF